MTIYYSDGQSSIFRTFQGWLAIRSVIFPQVPLISIFIHSELSLNSKAGPGQGTLKVFPDVLLSNAYIILRPFFRPLVSLSSKEILDAEKWEFGGPKIQGMLWSAD
jgi:hypothetical protein